MAGRTEATSMRPAKIFVVSAYDADIAALQRAKGSLPPWFPGVAVVPAHEASEVVRREELLSAAREAGVVLIRLLAGPESLGGLFEPLVTGCREGGVPLIVRRAYPMGEATLAEYSTVPEDVARHALDYLLHGGTGNAEQLLRYLADRFCGGNFGWEPPMPMPWEGYYVPGVAEPATLAQVQEAWWKARRPVVGIIFYRNLVQMGATDVVVALAEALDRAGANPLPVFAYGLRESSNGRDNAAAVRRLFADERGRPLAGAIISLMPFSASAPGRSGEVEEAAGLQPLGVPVIQGAMSLGTLEEWRENPAGLSRLDVALSAALPELDGRLISAPAGFRELEGEAPRIVWEVDRLERLAGLATRWARLGEVPRAEKRVAILLNNPNGRSSRVAAAFGLDALASVVRLLGALRAAGYQVTAAPADGDALARMLLETCPNDPETATEAQLQSAPARMPVERYLERYRRLPGETRAGIERHWGSAPGEFFVYGDALVVPGVILGNVFVGPQPHRGFALNPDAILHSPDLPPSHQYLAAYWWLEEVFGVDAIVQVGKHGNLEWLPGKGFGLSSSCYPDIALGELPLVYPYIVNNPGEGTQAKRRAAAAVVDHLVPPMAKAELYGELESARRALEALRDAAEVGAAAGQLEELAEKAVSAMTRAELEHDLGEPDGGDWGPFAREALHYLEELAGGLIPTGLHILGQTPSGTDFEELVLAIDQGLGDRSLAAAIGDGERTRAIVRVIIAGGPKEAQGFFAALSPEARTRAAAAAEALAAVVAALRKTPDELDRVVAALDGRAVPPGPAGAPTRGQADCLPTGRNFYGMDPRAMPGMAAWERGKRLAEEVLERYRSEEGEWPESIAVIAWGTANIRTQGEDIAQVLHLLGVEPTRDPRSGRVTGVDVVPLERLGRPRVDVVLRASGFFRDGFGAAIALVDEAVCRVAALDEPVEMNYVRKHLLSDLARGVAREEALFRVFAPKPGVYVDGVVQAVETGHWASRRDLAEVYAAWVDHAYTRERWGAAARGALVRRAGEVRVVLKTRDNEEHDVLDTDDYFQDFGAMVLLARELGGAPAKAWVGDSTRPDRPAVRTAEDETLRTFRRRAVNPKWLEGMERHGYQGGSEMLKTLEHAFGMDATLDVLEDWMYERLAGLYVLDGERQAFLREHNPWALRDMAARLLEAARRGMWEQPRRETLAGLEQAMLGAEGALEERMAVDAREDAR